MGEERWTMNEDLLNKLVLIKPRAGLHFTGRLIGICPEPSYIVELEDGSRVTIAQSAVNEMQQVTE